MTQPVTQRRTRLLLLAAVAGLLALGAAVLLVRQQDGLTVVHTQLAGLPATLWQPAAGGDGSLVVVAHGYAGSRQMMRSTAITLARAGHTVVTFDFYGHGRNPLPMDADITTLNGATAQLVAQTVAVTRAALTLPDVGPLIGLVGHSMATDIVIRTAAVLEADGDDEVAVAPAIVAISMYSDAVTPRFPARLLIISGAQEGRLRDVALDRLHQIDPAATEGQTVVAGDVARLVIAAPRVGHVGVLYSQTTLLALRDWIGAVQGQTTQVAAPPHQATLIAVMLGAVLAMIWPLAAVLGPVRPVARLPWWPIIAGIALPVVPAIAAAVLIPGGALGLTAFGGLAAFFVVWGGVQLVVLHQAGLRLGRIDLRGLALLLVWGGALFAVALDWAGAAFMPTGPRMTVMAILLLGTVPFCLADAMLTRRVGLVLRIIARAVPLAGLLGAMVLAPQLGIAFTVLPVMVLFWLVYGLAGGLIAARTSPTTAGLAWGISLAWAIAASTPLIAA